MQNFFLCAFFPEQNLLKLTLNDMLKIQIKVLAADLGVVPVEAQVEALVEALASVIGALQR